MTLRRPAPEEFNSYYSLYTNKVPSEDFLSVLEETLATSTAFYEQVPADKWDYRYAEGKWTLKEVLVHILDTERIMAYRALRVSRNDKTPMAGFDQNVYVPHYEVNARSVDSLLEEYKAVRQATIAQFRYMSDDMLARTGVASDSPVTPRALGFIIAGHEIHHLQIVRERYL